MTGHGEPRSDGTPARRGRLVTLLASVAVAAGLGILAAPAGAATIVVTRTDDPAPTDPSGCSLRQAVLAANANAVVGACTAGQTSLDTIQLSQSVLLDQPGLEDANAGGDLDVLGGGGGALRIVGTGDAPSEIRQAVTDRVLHLVSGSLTLERVVVRGGRATGTGVDGYGGGILAGGGTQLTLTEITVRGNTAVQAGGIANGTRTIGATGGTVLIQRSTVSGNIATANSGGGMGAGGIGNVNGAMSLVDSTVTGNASAGGRGGGLYNENAPSSAVTSTLSIANSTITGNAGSAGANVHNAGSGASATLTLRSTIVSDPRNDLNCGGAGAGIISTLGFNLADDGSCRLTAPTDLPATAPLLGPLADNGGATETHALLAGSPAIDAGTSDSAIPGVGLLTVDQRGAPRPVDRSDLPNAAAGDGADIGAVESPPPPAPPAPPPPAAPAADRSVTLAIIGRRARIGRTGVVRLLVRCPRTESSPPCRGALALRTRARVRVGGRLRQVTFARAAFRLGAGKAARVMLRLPRARVALASATRAARRALVVATVRDAAGNRATVRRQLTLVPAPVRR